MAKYINSEKHRIIVAQEKGLLTLEPGETLEVEKYIPHLSKYLVNESPVEKPEKTPSTKKPRGRSNGSKT